MIPIQHTEMPVLKFTPQESARDFRSESAKIGWLRAQGDPGTTFDFSIKDALGREKANKTNCKIATGDFGELINLPVMLGENLKVEVSNIKGGKEVFLFLN